MEGNTTHRPPYYTRECPTAWQSTIPHLPNPPHKVSQSHSAVTANIGVGAPSPPSMESSTMLGSRERTGNASCPRRPQKKSQRTAFFAFSVNDSNVVEAATATADTTPCE